MEAVREVEVLPAVRSGHRLIQLHVDGAHAICVRVDACLQLRVIDEVVELREAELASQHDLPPLGIQHAPNPLQLFRRLGTRKSLENIRRRVARVISHA